MSRTHLPLVLRGAFFCPDPAIRPLSNLSSLHKVRRFGFVDSTNRVSHFDLLSISTENSDWLPMLREFPTPTPLGIAVGIVLTKDMGYLVPLLHHPPVFLIAEIPVTSPISRGNPIPLSFSHTSLYSIISYWGVKIGGPSNSGHLMIVFREGAYQTSSGTGFGLESSA